LTGVLINVGSSSRDPNGRGRIFNDSSFEYLPIPEGSQTRGKVPTYRDLGFTDVTFPELPVHLDPEFKTYTYGHVRRGFGDITNLLRLEEGNTLFFFATLQQERYWSTYIIGHFKIENIYDCRQLSTQEILSFKSRGFASNSHLKRVNPSVDLLIKGGKGSKLLRRAFPLAEKQDHLALRNSLRDIIFTATGKKILSGTPWFRWTLTCESADELHRLIQNWQIQT